MKNVLSNTKLSAPSKLVRKVLSRSSTNKTNSDDATVPSSSSTSKMSKGSGVLELELSSLREQMAILQIAVNTMHHEAEQRDKALDNLENEKRRLSAHLKKEQRSHTTLKKQLQDERDFYYKEKEQYCQEMNDCKKIKKKLTEDLNNKQEMDATAEILDCKCRMAKLQDALNETLEANYNLSVKFLRMKNAKSSSKRRLKQHDLDHKKAMENLISKVNDIKTDLAEVVDKRFTLPISPSNKKYLHVIKQNGTLMYENLCLQMEIDGLHKQLEEYQFTKLRKESKIKFKVLHKSMSTQTEISKSERIKVKQISSHKTVSVSDVPSKSYHEDQTEPPIITVYEKDAKPGIPHIIMLPEDLPGIEFNDLNSKINSQGSQHASLNTESNSQFSTLVHCSSTKSTLRAQSSPDLIMSVAFVTKNKS